MKKISLVLHTIFELSIHRKFPESYIKSTLFPIKKLIGFIGKPKNVLDIGCGDGIFSFQILLASDADIEGFDIDPNKIDIASFLHRNYRSKFTVQSFHEYKSQKQFDLIIINDFLHHLNDENQDSALKFARDNVIDNGFIIIKEVSNLRSLDYALTRFLDSKLYPNDDLNFHSDNQWKQIFNKNGLTIKFDFLVNHLWPASRRIYICQKV